MPGPLPMDPKMRQRRNKTSTAATLSLAASGVDAPELPEREPDPETGLVPQWHPRTAAWWADVWSSPMASEFLDADVHGLYLLAELEDAFHWTRNTRDKMDLSKEIRLQRAMFGLTPMDRRRLQWEVERTESARDQGAKRRRKSAATGPIAATGAPSGDPRSILS